MYLFCCEVDDRYTTVANKTAQNSKGLPDEIIITWALLQKSNFIAEKYFCVYSSAQSRRNTVMPSLLLNASGKQKKPYIINRHQYFISLLRKEAD